MKIIRFSLILVVFLLIKDFYLWWEIYSQSGKFPVLSLFLINILGLIVVLMNLFTNDTSKGEAVLLGVWSVFFVLVGVLNSDLGAAFGLEGVLLAVVFSAIFYSLCISPAILYSVLSIRSGRENENGKISINKILLILGVVVFSTASFILVSPQKLCEYVNYQFTPFNKAMVKLISKRDESDAIQLLKDGLDANHKNVCGATLLQTASIVGSRNLVDVLLDKSADPNIKNSSGETAVYMAAQWGEVEILKSLLASGGNPDVTTDGSEYTPLMIATRNNQTAVVKLLVEYGANIKYSNSSGESALTIAKDSQNSEMLKVLSVDI